MFFQLYLAIFLAFACPKQTNTADHNGTTISAQDDDGGDNGHIPPGQTPPPPPPPPVFGD